MRTRGHLPKDSSRLAEHCRKTRCTVDRGLSTAKERLRRYVRPKYLRRVSDLCSLSPPTKYILVRKNGFATMKPTLLVTKPLGDKTPFPNRLSQALKTPAPQTAKLAKLSLFDESLAKTPGNLLLPSARRKSMRLPRSASKKFHTPSGQGNHWDVSDGDVQLDVSQEVEEVTSEEPDYDEIEYMPPKVPGKCSQPCDMGN